MLYPTPATERRAATEQNACPPSSLLLSMNAEGRSATVRKVTARDATGQKPRVDTAIADCYPSHAFTSRAPVTNQAPTSMIFADIRLHRPRRFR
jgi:hypothetical protein